MSPAKRTTTRKKTTEQPTTTDREVTTARHDEQAADAPPVDGSSTPGENVEERIRQKAYEIYRARNGAEGHDVEDWLAAEREIRHAHVPKEGERAASIST